jgi:hypothetical protein
MEGLNKREFTEQTITVKDTAEFKEVTIGETLDTKGGRVVPAPEFVELAEMGFSDGELSTILKLRQRFEEGGSDFTPEHKKLRFMRWMYQNGRLDS